SDGMILRSQATLWRSRVAETPDEQRATLDTLLKRLG
ncbi:ATP phosphoribosyltransferase catalytic subunit HisG, partial [Cribrihabitans sp. XS_ASV171]